MSRGWLGLACVVCVVALAGSYDAYACGTPVSIGVCEPETDGSAQGWDQMPAGGIWGGKPTNQFAVVWENDSPDKPELFGREATCTIPGVRGVIPRKIKLNYLEGLANDDFCVFVTRHGVDVRVGCFDEESAIEEWKDLELTLPRTLFAWGQDITVKIFATGNSWSGFDTWGQLAIDSIEIIGVERGRRWGECGCDDD
jgi:hypothetical protein